MSEEVLGVIGYENPEEIYKKTPITDEFKEFLVKHLPENLVSHFLSTEGIYICGGFMRAFYAQEEVNDIDFYFQNDDVGKLFNEKVLLSGYKPIFQSSRAITYKPNSSQSKSVIQTISFVSGNIENVLGEFDFTIVKCGASKAFIYKHAWFEGDLENKSLNYTGSKLPLSSLHRAFKYAKRGYSIRANQMIAISMDINKSVNFKSVESVIAAIKSFDPAEADRLL